MTKYYLNNNTDEDINIVLTAPRTIKAKSSFPLNIKDVEIFKKLRFTRRGNASIIHSLQLSTIKLEDDTNFKQAQASLNPKVDEKAKKDAEEKAKKEAEEKAKKELEEKAKKEAEEKAKKELEEKAAQEANNTKNNK